VKFSLDTCSGCNGYGDGNAVIPHAELEDTAYEWATRDIRKSPMAIKKC
jgi:1,4-dihydroxy-2-naphthoyl-CoA synthase